MFRIKNGRTVEWMPRASAAKNLEYLRHQAARDLCHIVEMPTDRDYFAVRGDWMTPLVRQARAALDDIDALLEEEAGWLQWTTTEPPKSHELIDDPC